MQTESARVGTSLNPTPFSVAGAWTSVLFAGLLTVGIGLIVLAWPEQTLKVLSVLLGLQLLLVGLFRLISAFGSDSTSPGLLGFVGVVGMGAGILVLRNPFETVALLATVLGIVWVITGLIDLIGSIADSTMEARGWVAAWGLLTLAAGTAVVVWPAPSVSAMAWITGVYFVAFGILLAFVAFQLRSEAP